MAGIRRDDDLRKPAAPVERPASVIPTLVVCLACGTSLSPSAFHGHGPCSVRRARRDGGSAAGPLPPTDGRFALLATRAASCAACGTRASELEWTHVCVGAAEHHSGAEWSGWVSRCPSCGREIDAIHDETRIA